jgi:hypothetical protein
MSRDLEHVDVEEVAPSVIDPEDLDMDDRNHPRWLHPIVPEGGGKGVLVAELEKRGLRPTGDYDTVLLYGGFYVSKHPARDGLYGIGTSPQYAIRRDYTRRTLEDTVMTLIRLLSGSR